MVERHTCEYIHASDLFKKHNETWNHFADSSPDFTWGSNNHSLVTVEAILNHMENTDIDCPRTFRKKCAEIGLQTYVDLEN